MNGSKEKISQAIRNYIAIEDTYTYELKRVKSAFEVGTVSLEDFEEWSEENVNDLTEAIIDATKPQLRENQEIVFEWLKDKYTTTNIEPIELFWRLHVNSKNRFKVLPIYKSYRYLTRTAQLEVLQVFSQWALEQEDMNYGKI